MSLSKLLRTSVVSMVSIGLMSVAIAPQPAAAQLKACDINPSSELCATEKKSNRGDGYSHVVKNVINILLYIVGVAAVVVIIISGIRFLISGGNTQTVQSAKSSLVYAVVGLLVAILAWSIVNYVLREVR